MHTVKTAAPEEVNVKSECQTNKYLIIVVGLQQVISGLI